MNSFEDVGKRLDAWTVQIRGTKGQGIADVTTKTIKDLCGDQYFNLPILKKYIDDYKRREGTLQSILSDYRDHFIHPFHVFCLGYYILNQWRIDNNKIMPLDIIGTDKEKLDLKKWFLTAIFHDVGYPAQKFEILVEDFFKKSVGRKISSHFDWSSVLLADENIKHIHELSKLFGNDAGCKDTVGIFKKWFHKRLLEEHDHGALSALMLCNQGWEIQDNIINEAALAIALHSWKRESDITSDENLYLFNWDEIPGNDNVRLKDILNRHFSIEWVKTAKIEKIDRCRVIKVSNGSNSLLLSLNDDKTKVNLKIDDCGPYEFIAKTENNKLNIYENFNLDKLAVENFPLSFFLSFCDTAQEWGRGVLLESMNNKDVSFDISGIEARLKDVQVDQSKTKVTIKYLAQKTDLVTDNKTLRDKFEEVGKDFEFTWYLKSNETTTFEIAGEDNKDFNIGSFGTR